MLTENIFNANGTQTDLDGTRGSSRESYTIGKIVELIASSPENRVASLEATGMGNPKF